MNHTCIICAFLRSLVVVGLCCSGCTANQPQDSNVGTHAVIHNGASSDRRYGSVRATFDHSGRVATVVIVKSMGSKILDQNTLTFAKKNWTGPPDTTRDVPIYYKMATTARPQA